jgi:hypothetical protein
MLQTNNGDTMTLSVEDCIKGSGKKQKTKQQNKKTPNGTLILLSYSKKMLVSFAFMCSAFLLLLNVDEMLRITTENLTHSLLNNCIFHTLK